MPNLSKPTVLTAFDLPPEEAVKFLTKKITRPTWAWNELTETAHQKAFTVAKAVQADVLTSIRSALQEAQAKGTPFETFKAQLEPILKAKGWWGKRTLVNPLTGTPQSVQLGSPWRLETVYRTNLQSAFQAGRYKQQQATANRRPYLQYHAIADIRTTGVCRDLHLKVFPVDDPIWTRAYPPNHFNCRARVVSLSNGELERLGLTPEQGSSFNGWKPEEGFAASPATNWEPDIRKYPTGIREQLAFALQRGTEDRASAASMPEAEARTIAAESLASLHKRIGGARVLNLPKIIDSPDYFQQPGNKVSEAVYFKETEEIAFNWDKMQSVGQLKSATAHEFAHHIFFRLDVELLDEFEEFRAAVQDTDTHNSWIIIDTQSKNDYFADEVEYFSRTFEQYIARKFNDTEIKKWLDNDGGYFTPKELPNVIKVFEKLLKAAGVKLQR